MEPKGNKDLYEHAKEMMKEAYKKPKHNGKRYDKMLGHLLQSLFQSKDVWTLKDLDDAQLLKLMGQADEIIKRKREREEKIGARPSPIVGVMRNLGGLYFFKMLCYGGCRVWKISDLDPKSKPINRLSTSTYSVKPSGWGM